MERFFKRGGAWVLAQAVVLIAVFGGPFLLPQFDVPTWPAALGWARLVLATIFLATGGLFLVAGIVALGRRLTPLPAPLEHTKLQTEGIYRWVRHPIYGGIVLLAIGVAFATAILIEFPLAVVAFAFFDRKASFEERLLVQKFESYQDYRSRTRKLIPFVY